MTYPVETTDGRTVNIVKKQYVANQGVYLTSDEGEEFVVVGNGQKAEPVSEASASHLRPTLPAKGEEEATEEAPAEEPTGNAEPEEEPSEEDAADPDEAEAQV
jgi:hypothetical protein